MTYYEGAEINLGGKVCRIKYTAKSLKLLAKRFGSAKKAFEKIQALGSEITTEDMDTVVFLLYAGLIHENLTIEELENMLTMLILPTILDSVLQPKTSIESKKSRWHSLVKLLKGVR